MRRFAFALVVAAATAALAQEAAPAPALDETTITLPQDGAVDVPVNALLAVAVRDVGVTFAVLPAARWDTLGDAALEDAAALEGADVGFGTGAPGALSPSTEYVAVAASYDGAARRTWRFTTAAQRDDEAPAAPAAALAGLTWHPSHDAPSIGCGPMGQPDGWDVTVDVAAVESAVAYAIYEDEGDGWRRHVGGRVVTAEGHDATIVVDGFLVEDGRTARTLTVVALDAAGNESASTVSLALPAAPAADSCAAVSPSTTGFIALVGALFARLRRAR